MGIWDRLAAAAKNRRPSAADQMYNEIGTERTRGAGYDAQAEGSRKQYEDILNGGQGALNDYVRSAISSGMPEFDKSLQDIRESSVRRGVGNGGLGTSYEGDLASAFERNIANATAGQAMNLYNTRAGGAANLYGTDVYRSEGSRSRLLDILSGQRDYELAQENAKRKKKGGLFGALGGIVGGVGGFLLGGPEGAYAGARIGSGAGSAIGG